ncbi:ran-binding protein 1-like b-like, partial [Trifolium medium]|nr:ran-binding protein 1-like b-like [Trifolium medium]
MADLEHHEGEDTPAIGGDDEDTRSEIAPLVELEEVVITIGEEDEDAILDL